MTGPALRESEVDGSVAQAPWLLLNHRMLFVQLKWLVPPALSTVFYAMVSMGHLDGAAFLRLGSITLVFVLIMLWRVVDLLTTRYRVTRELFEIRSGLIGRHHRSIPCDRIRRVDLTADPFHRIFGLTVVRIATAQHSSTEEHEIKLEALRREDAHQLRAQLLRRAEVLREERGEQEQAEDGNLLARINWAWLRYAPMTIWGVLGTAIVGGMAFRFLDGFGVKPMVIFTAVWDYLGSTPLWELIVVGTVGMLVIGTLAAMAVFVEEWWGYRLQREEDNTLSVHRGLLTTRSLTVDERRMRGVEIGEPLLLRLGGGAHVAAVATGLQQSGEEEIKKLKVLTPNMPRGLAHDVAGSLVGELPSPTEAAQLVRHPRSALRRRFNRAGLAILGFVAVLVILGLLFTPVLIQIAWISGLALIPFGALLAYDAYRNLGHALHGRHLVTRYGTFDRRTVALQRDGIIGWKIVRSPTQRWSGLATVVATTAAGSEGAYKVRDVHLAEGLAFADQAVPDLLAPFLERAN